MTLADLLPKLHYPTRLEKLVDGWVHGVALVVFTLAVGTALGLAIWQGGLVMASAVAVYGVCVVTMIACSMAYNLAENHKRKSLLRRFDHAAGRRIDDRRDAARLGVEDVLRHASTPSSERRKSANARASRALACPLPCGFARAGAPLL